MFCYFFMLGFGATVCVSLKRRVRRTLYGLYCPYSVDEVSKKGEGTHCDACNLNWHTSN